MRPLIDIAVDRFLGWKLPEDFSPDAGISFEPVCNKGTLYPRRNEPIGTNLLHAGQAKAMLEYVAEPLLNRIAELESPDPLNVGRIEELEDLVMELRGRMAWLDETQWVKIIDAVMGDA